MSSLVFSFRLGTATSEKLARLYADAAALSAGLDALDPDTAAPLAPLVQRLLDIVDALDGPFVIESCVSAGEEDGDVAVLP